MTSYFEIAGHIVECHEVMTSPELAAFVSEVAVPIARRATETFESAARDKIETRDPLWEHWLKVVSLPARELGPMLWKPNPYLLAVKGVAVGIRQVEMNYDYFIKGESHEW